MKLYVVTSGCYSDYRIDCIFSSQEVALKFLADYASALGRKERGFGDNEKRIEEYELDEMMGAHSFILWSITLGLERGEVRLSQGPEPRFGLPPAAVDLFDGATDRKSNWIMGHSTKSEDHAMKLAVEGRQAWLRRTPKLGVRKAEGGESEHD